MAKEINKVLVGKLEGFVRACEAIRKDTTCPVDITLAEYVMANETISMEALYEQVGINPNVATVQNLVNMPDAAYRWLIPEIYRDALRLGLRKSPIYPELIAGEQTVGQTQVIMPAINMSEAVPAAVGVGETITTGDVSFGQKVVKIHKFGRGIKVPYEVIQYVSLNMVSIFLQDFGVKLGLGIDTMALNTLINGDQADGSDSAAVIGVNTPGSLVFRDTLRPFVRLSRLGKTAGMIIGGEDMSMDILDLFTLSRYFGEARQKVNFKTPLPQNANVYVHGKIPTSQALILDASAAMVKLNAQPLLIETEKIVSNQTEATYATITTGFATLFRDSRIMLDKSQDFVAAGFPTWMDPTSQEIVNFQ